MPVHDDSLGSATCLRIVAIGASAGGLDAIVRFFASAARRGGVAYVVVQHLSQDHRSLMPELLSRHTELPVVRVLDETPIETDHIYLMPPQQNMTFSGGRLRLLPRDEAGVHHPIDCFLNSIAASLGAKAIGVVMSGTGRDGTKGSVAVHAAGGVVIAQDPATAGFDGMPASVIEAGVADMVLPPEEMPAAIQRVIDGVHEPRASEEPEIQSVRDIIASLSRGSGVDFSEYKTATIVRRAHRRRGELGLENLDQYSRRVADDPVESERLRHEILIGVSSFFRDRSTFTALEQVVVPELLERSRTDGTTRVWSMACSTGQEPYSVAMLLLEQAKAQEPPIQPEIFASDIDRQSIEQAARGFYPRDAVAHITPERLARFFLESGGGYQVLPALRQAVLFSVHNALRDPPFARLDLVCCRNLIIYLRPAAQRKVITRCLTALKPGGFLVLGSSESIGDLGEAFDIVDARARIFRRKGGTSAPYSFSTRTINRPSAPRGVGGATVEPRLIAEEASRRLVQLDSPPSLVLDAANTIVHTTGVLNAYFSLPVGQPSVDATRLARGNLSVLLTAALARSRRNRDTVEYRGVDLRLGDSEEVRRIDLRITPLGPKLSDHHLVSFRPVEPTEPEDAASSENTLDAKSLQSLRLELESTRENLQSAIEELETTNEELQAANEELVATNEELQAANEELISANAENERRIRDLVDLNADIDNLMRSTDIGTLFLDEHLSVRRFTPLVCDFVSLLDRDIGRPLAHVRHALIGLDLPEFAMQVLRAGNRLEAAATTASGRHILVRAVPYQIKSETRGVVVSFVDVTELAAARAHLEGVMDALPEQVAVLDATGRIVRVNRAWREFGEANGVHPSWEPIGADYLGVLERGLPDAPEVGGAIDGIRRLLSVGGPRFSAEYRCDSPSEERHFYMHANPLSTGGLVISHVEVTPVVRASRELEQGVAIYRRLFSISTEPLLLVDPRDLRLVEFNQAATRALGCTADELAARTLGEVLELDSGDWPALLHSALQLGVVPDTPARVPPHSGSEDDPLGTVVSLHAVEARASKLVVVTMRAGAAGSHPTPTAGISGSMHSQKMEALGRLAGGIAHELNNVLTAILAVCSARRQELPGDDPVAQDLEVVLAACGRGADLTRNLLGFARQSSVARDSFDLADAAREVVALLTRSTPSRISISLRTKSAATVRGDRSQVAQALMNLCLNARDSIRGSGSIVIEVGVEPGAADRDAETRYAYLRVTDDGTGMDAATRQRAFEPFFTTKPRGEGTGLGLSMVYGVAKGHGGWVEISSRLGVGTSVKLSMSEAPGPTTVSPPVAHARGGGALVLLVDDDDMVRTSMARLLSTRGYAVEAVSGGNDAVARVRSPDARPVDIVLLDISMPDLDGLAVLELIRTSHPLLPVLLYSGYPDRVPQQTLDLDQRTGFCAKPIALPELLTNLGALLGASVRTPK